MNARRISVFTLIGLSLLISLSILLHPLSAQSRAMANDAGPLLRSILIAHRAWVSPPASIRIRGTSMKGPDRHPVTITATKKEEAAIAYGSARRVTTPSSHFQDDGQNSTFASVPSGFDQLDITGIFLISQMTQRQSKAGPPEFFHSKDGRGEQFHLSSARTKMHFRQIAVTDELDVLVGASGLLAGLERTFYPGDSRLRYTSGYRFSDYRDSGGVLLPYRIDVTFKGNIEESILVTDYQIDVPLNPSLFASRPKSGRAQ